MFESITDKFSDILRKVAGGGRLTEANLKDIVRLIRRALIDADVNIAVAKTFCDRIKERALGQAIEKQIHPEQAFAKILRDELTEFMGGALEPLKFHSTRPTVIMMVGLNGAGKTTTTGKLALLLRRRYKKDVLMVAADLQRPAAIEQLQVLGKQLDVPVYAGEAGGSPTKTCTLAVKQAARENRDVVILDTAGRLQIDEPLMQELADVKKKVAPDYIFLVVDGMTGQDAVKSADGFNQRLSIDNVILTKMDGDAKGGAALSVCEVTGTRVRFIGDGEKPDDLRDFDPGSMAARILGGGDIALLADQAEKIREHIDADAAQDQLDKLFTKSFTLDDFLSQLNMLSKMPGGMGKMLEALPQGAMPAGLTDEMDDGALDRIRAMIQSMTVKERAKPDVIEHSRRRRIAEGSGATPVEVNELLKSFKLMKKQMDSLLGGGDGGMGMLGKIAGHQFRRHKKKQLKEQKRAHTKIKRDGRKGKGKGSKSRKR